MTSSPITSWQIDGEKMKTVADFIFLGSKITVDADCSHEIWKHLLLGRKATTNLDNGPYTQSCDFYSSRIRMWELDHKEI